MRTELVINGNAVYEIDIDCKERHMEERGFSDERELSQMAFSAGKKNRGIRILCLFLLFVFAVQSSG